MNRTRIALNIHLLGGLLMGMFALLLLPAGGTSAVALASNCGQWSIVASPNPGSTDILGGITAISPQDVWAVGNYVDIRDLHQVLIEHWNGTQWRVIPSPNLDTLDNGLSGVAFLSSTDVWAVGATSSGTLIEHWDGTRWRVIPSPGARGVLLGVSTLSSTDIWAVGDVVVGRTTNTLTEHWDGSTWSILKSPSPGAFGNQLVSVAAISSTNVWAVGYTATTRFGEQALVEHWNGTQWRVVKSPSLGQFPYDLRGVSAVAANDIWAVGTYATAPGDISLTLTEQWNGKTWSVIPSPSPTGNDFLLGVAALSTSDVWAVGDYSPAGQNLVVHWNGTSWNVVPSPYRHGTVSSLSAIAGDSAGDIWAAGIDINTHNYQYHTLIEHDC
jgi:hypothetical protein